jgi:hypothetical protein
MKSPTVTATAHMLYLQIGTEPQAVLNPRVLELIDAGMVTETAPRRTETAGGLCVTTYIVQRAELAR